MENRRATDQSWVVVSIAGFDPTGGAGLLADAGALAQLGLRPAGVVTALTVQRPSGDVETTPVDPQLVDRTLSTVLSDLPVAAMKIGMLGTGEVAEVVAGHLEKLDPSIPVVCDPVLHAGAGGALADERTTQVLREKILPRTTLLTPNVPEAEILAGRSIQTQEDMEAVARDLCAGGATYVLLKGGHLAGDPVDLLIGPDNLQRWRGKRLDVGAVHGTGCALSALIAGYLSLGKTITQAVDASVAAVHEAIAASWQPQEEGWRYLGPLPV